MKAIANKALDILVTILSFTIPAVVLIVILVANGGNIGATQQKIQHGGSI